MQHLFSNIRNQRILITGGAGYIGRIAHVFLENFGAEVWVLDDLSGKGTPFKTTNFVNASLLNGAELNHLFNEVHFDAVLHLAAKIDVGESVREPDLYWTNNVVGSQQLLSAMNAHCSNIVFASSAAVYGNQEIRVTENSTLAPTSPYGKGKLAVERLIKDQQCSSICFRLFNVAGAIAHPHHRNAMLGEEHIPETHLIPKVIQHTLQHKPFSVFGNTHPTPDGTCIREYVHVQDVVTALCRGLDHLVGSNQPTHHVLNISSGKGHSVHEVVACIAEEAVALGLPTVRSTISGPRHGDPARIESNIQSASTLLGWEPKNSKLKNIVHSSWKHQLLLQSQLGHQSS